MIIYRLEKNKMVVTKVLPSKIPTSSPKVIGLPKSKVIIFFI